jgi:hypothetical protein
MQRMVFAGDLKRTRGRQVAGIGNLGLYKTQPKKNITSHCRNQGKGISQHVLLLPDHVALE